MKQRRNSYGLNKVQDFRRLYQAKRKQMLVKSDKRQQERELYRTIRAAKEKINVSTCQALNRFGRQCKSRVVDQSDFCKIHQFNDSMSGLVQCIGTNKILKQCIKSVPVDEKYCKYHRNKRSIKSG